MAKRGRRSIRNKRKSVKKYSHKRRSKTMRYLRGGVFPEDKYIVPPSLTREEQIIQKQKNFDECMKPCFSITNDNDKQDRCMKRCSAFANFWSDPFEIYSGESFPAGGRRRYYKRKQFKTRKH